MTASYTRKLLLKVVQLGRLLISQCQACILVFLTCTTFVEYMVSHLNLPTGEFHNVTVTAVIAGQRCTVSPQPRRQIL